MVAAFFDVDGTLTDTNVVLPLVWFRRATLPQSRFRFWLMGLAVRVPCYLLADRIDRHWFVRLFFREYAGLDAEQLRRWHAKHFAQTLQPRIFPAALRQLRWHQTQGHHVVLVTGGADFVAAPLAQWLGADLLATQLEVRDGKLTGRFAHPPLVGVAKAEAVRRYAAQHGIDLSVSYAYGDDISDVPLLTCVGHPVAVNPDQRLRRLAQQKNWRIVNWR